MCERSENVGHCEEIQDTSDQTSQDSGVIKFDIGDFVHTERKIKLLVHPAATFYQKIVHILRWESPHVSLLGLLVCCYAAITSPVYFIIIPLLYISVSLVTSGIHKKGLSGSQERGIRNGNYIRRIADESDLNVKLAVEKQAQEDLKEYIRLLVQIETLSEELCIYLEKLNSIFRWENVKRSSWFLAGCLFSIVALWLFPFQWLMLLGLLGLFCLNSGFKQVLRTYSWTTLLYIEKVSSQLGLQDYMTALTGRRLQRRSFVGSTDLDDEWFDAQPSGSGLGSDDEEESLGDEVYQEEPHQKRGLPEYKSVVSRLVDYREKQRKLNSGNCSTCNVPFTSILKKRQYCRHCGNSFCSRCCAHRVKRAVFGATAPAAYEETVLVCKPCFDCLMNTLSDDKSDVW